jgi:hypothetical protein
MLSKCFIASSGNLKTEHSDPNLWFPHQHPSLRTASLLRRKVASLFFEVNDVHKTNFPESLSLSCEDESVKFLSCLIKTTKILIEKDLWIVL